MIPALLLGRKGSVGFPGKNMMDVLGWPLAWYAMSAGLEAKLVDKLYLSTDDEELMALARENGAEVIERPDYLCTKEALGEDAYVHGYEEICARQGERPEIVVLLFCNAPTVLPETIDKGIQVLQAHPDYDSAVTVSAFNMYSPIRARKENKEGLLEPFIPFETFGDQFEVNCDRDCQGDVWFADCALSVVRSRNLENLDAGILPQKWMGRRIYPLKQTAGLDVDMAWQVPIAEWWLKQYRLADTSAE